MRSHVVFAWELGFGYGHISQIAALAEIFIKKSHRVSVVTHFPTKNLLGFLPDGVELYQAPNHSAKPKPFPPSINYSANLLRNGFYDEVTAIKRLSVWKELLEKIKPDILVIDHAPSAMLASINLSCARVAIGNGFTLPPISDPMPTLQPWLDVPDSILKTADQNLLAVINSSLGELGLRKLQSVADIFTNTSRFICIEEEFDHYDIRRGEIYHGAMEPFGKNSELFETIDLPNNFIFIYLSADNKFLKPTLTYLSNFGMPVIGYISGQIDPDYSGLISQLPNLINLKSLVGRCLFAITEGNTQTTAFLIKHGIKLLICPRDLEKAVMGFRLNQRQLARTCNWFAGADGVLNQLEKLARGDAPPQNLAYCELRYKSTVSRDSSLFVATAIEENLS